jgi:hypothetical protein
MSVTQRSRANGGIAPGYQNVASASPAAAGTYTPDLRVGDRHIVTMPAGNITIAAPVNGRTGSKLDLTIVQDGVGSRTVTWNAAYKFTGAASPTLTTTASRRDTFRFVNNGTFWEETGRTLNVG